MNVVHISAVLSMKYVFDQDSIVFVSENARDIVIHVCEIINMTGESYRLSHRKYITL